MTTSPARYALPPHGTSGARAVTPRRREAKPAAGALYSVADTPRGTGQHAPLNKPGQFRRSATGMVCFGGDGPEPAATAAESATARPNHSTALAYR
jgi:hypothetical protein